MSQPVDASRPDLVEVVSEVLHSFEATWVRYRQQAEAVLAALSSVGALMPDGGETREELGFGTQRPPAIGPVQVWWADDPQHASWTPTRRRTVTTYPDGSTLTSAWTETTDAQPRT